MSMKEDPPQPSQMIAGAGLLWLGNLGIFTATTILSVACEVNDLLSQNGTNDLLSQNGTLVFYLFLLGQGVVQWLYVLPIWLWLRRRRRGLAVGAILGAALYTMGHTGFIVTLMLLMATFLV